MTRHLRLPAALLLSILLFGCGAGTAEKALQSAKPETQAEPSSVSTDAPPPEARPPAVSSQDRGGPERRGAGAGHAPYFPLRTLWSHRGSGAFRSAPAVGTERLYLLGTDGVLTALDRKDGRVLWTFKAAAPAFAAPAFDEGAVYAADGRGVLYAVDPVEGRELWRRETGNAVSASLLLHEGLIVAAGDRGLVSAFKSAGGEPVWRMDMKSPVVAAPSASKGRVYIGTEGGVVAALSAADGKELWRKEFGGAVYGSVIPWEDAVFGAVSGNSGGEYFLLDSAAGNLRWSQRIKKGIFASAASGADSAVFAESDGTIFSVDLRSGIIRWRTGLFEPVSLAPLLVDGGVLAATDESVLYRLDTETGVISGRTSLPRGAASSPVVLGGALFLGTAGNGFYVLDGPDSEAGEKNSKSPDLPVLPPYLKEGGDLEIYLPTAGLRVELAPLSGQHYVEVWGETLRPVTVKLLNEEGSVLAENLGYTALERGFSFRFEGKKKYFLKVDPVKLDGGLIPVRLRVKPTGAKP